jgi:hypothetical protein
MRPKAATFPTSLAEGPHPLPVPSASSRSSRERPTISPDQKWSGLFLFGTDCNEYPIGLYRDMQSVAETPTFTRQAEKLFDETEKMELISFL